MRVPGGRFLCGGVCGVTSHDTYIQVVGGQNVEMKYYELQKH